MIHNICYATLSWYQGLQPARSSGVGFGQQIQHAAQAIALIMRGGQGAFRGAGLSTIYPCTQHAGAIFNSYLYFLNN